MTLDAGWPLSRVGRCRNSSDCHTPYLRIMGRADRHPPVQEAGARPQGDDRASYAVMLPPPLARSCQVWRPPLKQPRFGLAQ